MNEEILKFKPIFFPKIWGGNKLTKMFEKKLSTDKIGEAWLVSAHENGDTVVAEGPYQDMKLSQVYKEAPHLFNNKTNDEFPLLVKIIDAASDLSVQVHPNDYYANKVGERYGKEEVWFVLDANEKQKVQYGHHSKSKDEFAALINYKKWDQLLKYTTISKYDLVPVMPGTIHAIMGGTLVLEIQQSSDTTYRIYDYDRQTEDGSYRDLHIEEALMVSNIPDSSEKIVHYEFTEKSVASLWQGNHFRIEVWNTKEMMKIKKSQNSFYILTLISGNGTINNVSVKSGDALIVTAPVSEVTLTGNLHVVVAVPL